MGASVCVVGPASAVVVVGRASPVGHGEVGRVSSGRSCVIGSVVRHRSNRRGPPVTPWRDTPPGGTGHRRPATSPDAERSRPDRLRGGTPPGRRPPAPRVRTAHPDLDRAAEPANGRNRLARNAPRPPKSPRGSASLHGHTPGPRTAIGDDTQMAGRPTPIGPRAGRPVGGTGRRRRGRLGDTGRGASCRRPGHGRTTRTELVRRIPRLPAMTLHQPSGRQVLAGPPGPGSPTSVGAEVLRVGRDTGCSPFVPGTRRGPVSGCSATAAVLP